MKITPLILSLLSCLLLSSCLDQFKNVLNDDTETLTNTNTNTNTKTDDDPITCVALASSLSFESEIHNKTANFDATSSYVTGCNDTLEIGLYKWNFGDGTIVETNSPLITHQYQSVGEYEVTLNLSADLKVTQTIIISEQNACADISLNQSNCETQTDTDVCIALASQAIFKTTITEDALLFDASESYFFEGCQFIAVEQYSWDFGDGVIVKSNTPIISHTYEFSGPQTVELTIINEGREVKYIEHIDYKSVQDCDEAMFIHNNILGKEAELKAMLLPECAEFATEYHWDFGNGQSAKGSEIIYVYPEFGFYTLTLTVTLGQAKISNAITIVVSHSDTDLNCITVYDVHVEFEEMYSEKSTVNFDASSSYNYDCSTHNELNNFYWDFGDGTTSTTDYAYISHQYQHNGEYEVTLSDHAHNPIASYSKVITIEDVGSCVDVVVPASNEEIVQNIVLLPNCDSFTLQQNPIIQNADRVQFSVEQNAFTPEQLSYQWHSSDGQSSTQSEFDITFSENGIYIITVEILGPNYFIWSSSIQYEVKYDYCSYASIAPLEDARIINVDIEGLTVKLTSNTQRSDCYGNEINVWDLGDGTVIESEESTIIHTYQSPGEYDVLLQTPWGMDRQTIIVNNDQCVQTTYPTFSITQLNEFEYRFDASGTSSGCVGLNYHWRFGDSQEYETSQAVVTHNFEEHGEYLITLKTDNHNQVSAQLNTQALTGSSTIILRSQYYFLNEYVQFSALAHKIKINNEQPELIQNQDTDMPSTLPAPNVDFAYQYEWNFGDSTQYITDLDQAYGSYYQHEYVVGGTYQISVNAALMTGEQITDSFEVEVEHIDKIIASMEAVVNSNQVSITASAAFNGIALNAMPLNYTWELGDGTSYDGIELSQIDHVYTNDGLYEVKLVITSQNQEYTKTLKHVVKIKAIQ
ncbi:PKD domain-containing protein [Marinicellulosiphila megalodicopiae]|uniref:PKD domain-containing protein n=1 Tax=Marinicellulosiphila megalodicopiae TaxID=2724896 RepID=UPI003BAEE868